MQQTHVLSTLVSAHWTIFQEWWQLTYLRMDFAYDTNHFATTNWFLVSCRQFSVEILINFAISWNALIAVQRTNKQEKTQSLERIYLQLQWKESLRVNCLPRKKSHRASIGIKGCARLQCRFICSLFFLPAITILIQFFWNTMQ